MKTYYVAYPESDDDILWLTVKPIQAESAEDARTIAESHCGDVEYGGCAVFEHPPILRTESWSGREES